MKLTQMNENITIRSKKVDWVRSFRFWPETVPRFVNSPNRCIKCNTSMVFCTVMKLTETNQNITVGSKTVDWVRSFRFWPESEHCFGSGPNRCIKCNTGMAFCTITKLTEMNQNITIGFKIVDWLRSFHFWPETLPRFVNGPNRCIKCNTGMVFCTVMKLTETNQNITVGSKKVDWVSSFRFWPETVPRFVNGPNRCIKCNTGMVFCTVTKLTETNQNITIGSKKVDWSVRFVSGPKLCLVTLTAPIGALNATQAWFFAQ